MYRDEERSRGVLLKVLDLSALEAAALEYRQKERPDCYEVSIHGGETAIAEKDGKIYAICTEGVGYEISDKEPLELMFHGRYYTRDEETGEIDPHKHSFDMMPFASVDKTPEELKEYPIKAEVDLADHVRTFGARLENNFWLWYRELS